MWFIHMLACLHPLEGWPTRAVETLSPHKVRLNLLDKNPAFLSLTKNALDNNFISSPNLQILNSLWT